MTWPQINGCRSYEADPFLGGMSPYTSAPWYTNTVIHYNCYLNKFSEIQYLVHLVLVSQTQQQDRPGVAPAQAVAAPQSRSCLPQGPCARSSHCLTVSAIDANSSFRLKYLNWCKLGSTCFGKAPDPHSLISKLTFPRCWQTDVARKSTGGSQRGSLNGLTVLQQWRLLISAVPSPWARN